MAHALGDQLMSPSGSALSPLAVAAAEIVNGHRQPEVLPELLEKKLGLERWQAVLTLKELGEAGYGKYIVGRRGGETRLEKSEKMPAELHANPIGIASGERPSEICQTLQLMRSPPFRIEVPADLTSNEAEKIARWLKAIAIDAPDQ